MIDPLLVIVPTRGRPGNALRLAEAFDETAIDARLVFAFDADDPCADAYRGLSHEHHLVELPHWLPMCVKLNHVATHFAHDFRHLGFMGDDHLPRTAGWDKRIVDTLDDTAYGVVYVDDGHQGPALPTSVFMDARVVRCVGWMVPPGIEHLYCDNAWKDLGEALGTLTYLPDVLVEHLHPHAGKAPSDDQYERVNSGEQYNHDAAAWEQWRSGQLASDVAAIRRQ